MTVERNGNDGLTDGPKGQGRISKSNYFINLIGSIEELEANMLLLFEKNKKDIPESTVKQILYSLDLLKQELYLNNIKDYQPIINILDSSISFMSQKVQIESTLIKSSQAKAETYVVRAVCRRVERFLVDYMEKNKITCQNTSIEFLNRLSTYLLLLADYIF